MAYKLTISKEAHKDTDSIVHYIAEELVNPAAAAGFLDDVEKSYHVVVNKPYMYSLCHDARLNREGYRKIVIKNYIIIYRIDDETKAVYIMRIIYGGRNYVNFI